MNRFDEAVNKTTVPLAQILEPIRQELAAVEREFVQQIESQVALIPEIGRYIQQSGGKRVRPAVLLLAARMAGYRGDLSVLYASVVEYIHAATLVHDDIVDNSEVRRGRRSVHSRWGADVTVLLGDYLYIKSMDMALKQDALDVLRLLSDVTLRMIEGELLQLSRNGDLRITEEAHLDIVRRKTAVLFGGCAEIGAVLGGLPAGQREWLRGYGENLGMTFQLVDDLLDLTGDQEALGKPIGGDLREGKLTLPLIHLLRHGEDGAADLVSRVFAERQLTASDWERLSDMLRRHRSIEAAFERASAFAEAAKVQLAGFPPSSARDALAALPEYVLLRDR
jgi:octaprenyl-diphosphate synthase